VKSKIILSLVKNSIETVDFFVIVQFKILIENKFYSSNLFFDCC